LLALFSIGDTTFDIEEETLPFYTLIIPVMMPPVFTGALVFWAL